MSELIKMLNIQAELYKKNGANSLSALLDNAASELQATQEKILKAQQEIDRLESEKDAALSSYGDAWYDGFLAARDFEREQSHMSISDVTDDEVLSLSEQAESEHAEKFEKVVGNE